MNKNTKFANPMKVITGPNTRWSYANVWEPKSINGGAPKYSVSLIIPKSDTKTVSKIQAAIEAAYREGEAKLKGNGKSVPALSVIKTPLRDGDTVSYKEARENMKAIYGIRLGEEVPLQIELEEVEGRLTKLRESYEREKDSNQKDMVERLKNAIRAHEERVESLRARLAK